MLMMPDRPAESETVGVVRRPERVARGAVRDTHGLSGSRAGGSWFAASLAVESVAEAPALGAGVDDVSLVGDPVNDGLREPRVGGYFGPLAERQVRGHDQRPAFVAFADDLERRARRRRPGGPDTPARPRAGPRFGSG